MMRRLLKEIYDPQVVEMLKAEVLAALNTTYTEADWPKGTKRGECCMIYDAFVFVSRLFIIM